MSARARLECCGFRRGLSVSSLRHRRCFAPALRSPMSKYYRGGVVNGGGNNGAGGCPDNSLRRPHSKSCSFVGLRPRGSQHARAMTTSWTLSQWKGGLKQLRSCETGRTAAVLAVKKVVVWHPAQQLCLRHSQAGGPSHKALSLAPALGEGRESGMLNGRRVQWPR